MLDYSFDSSEPGDKTGNYVDNLVLFRELVCSLPQRAAHDKNRLPQTQTTNEQPSSSPPDTTPACRAPS